MLCCVSTCTFKDCLHFLFPESCSGKVSEWVCAFPEEERGHVSTLIKTYIDDQIFICCTLSHQGSQRCSSIQEIFVKLSNSGSLRITEVINAVVQLQFESQAWIKASILTLKHSSS